MRGRFPDAKRLKRSEAPGAEKRRQPGSRPSYSVASSRGCGKKYTPSGSYQDHNRNFAEGNGYRDYLQVLTAAFSAPLPAPMARAAPAMALAWGHLPLNAAARAAAGAFARAKAAQRCFALALLQRE